MPGSAVFAGTPEWVDDVSIVPLCIAALPMGALGAGMLTAAGTTAFRVPVVRAWCDFTSFDAEVCFIAASLLAACTGVLTSEAPVCVAGAAVRTSEPFCWAKPLIGRIARPVAKIPLVASVRRRFIVGFLSTGEELVDPGCAA